VNFGCGGFEIHEGNHMDLAGNDKLLELSRLCSRKKKGGEGRGMTHEEEARRQKKKKPAHLV